MKATPGIQSRLLLLGILPAALIGLALAAYFIHARIVDLDRGLAARGDRITRELAAASVSLIAAGNRVALQELAEAVAMEEDILEVGIFDPQGGVLASERTPPPKGEDVATRLLRTAPIFANAGGKPAVDSPLVLGSTRLVLSRIATFKRQRETILFSLLILLGGLLASSLLARRIAQKIGGPVMDLTLAVHELSKGNMDARAETDPGTAAELAYLQAGFNAMATELQKNRDALELQVRQATARLQEALAALEKRNKELEAARWLAEAQTELKSRFLAQVSHEIRTPMNGIIGFAELLANTSLNQGQAEKLGLIMRSATNLLSIINDILDLSKLEAGKITLDSKSFALRPCLEDVVCLLSARAARTTAIVLWIAPDVPRAVVGDPVRLQQVVANLLGNALKFTRQGKIVVRVRLWPGQGRLLFSVSDSGSGISPQDQAKLFSPFWQLREYADGTDKGSGLGLSIAKNIVETMGGKIRLASRLGRGTSLWFDLPLLTAEAPAKAFVLEGKVALVEADRLLRLAVVSQLRRLGVQVEAFADVDELVGRYVQGAGPRSSLYGLWPQRGKADVALPHWLEWCEEKRLQPIVLFPSGERRLVDFYRKRGAVCLFHPVRDEALLKAFGGQAPAPEPAHGAQAESALGGHGLKLLVADDNEINRLLLKAQLGQFEADIVEACNGKEALDRLRQQRFDLVFLDLQMPLMDGPRVLRELRDHAGPNRHTSVIAVTAFLAPGQRDAILQEGFADCLTKPILHEHLSGVVEAWLGARSKRSASEAGVWDYASAILAKAGGNRDLAMLVARKLFAELPQALRQVETELGRRDREAARHVVHKLNGSAAFSGLESLRLAAAALESALNQGKDWGEMAGLCRDLARETETFLALESVLLDLLGRSQTAP